MLKNIERFLNLSTFMIFRCFAIHAWNFYYLKNCIKITYTKEIGKLETYMVFCGIMIFMLRYIKC